MRFVQTVGADLCVCPCGIVALTRYIPDGTDLSGVQIYSLFVGATPASPVFIFAAISGEACLAPTIFPRKSYIAIFVGAILAVALSSRAGARPAPTFTETATDELKGLGEIDNERSYFFRPFFGVQGQYLLLLQ